MPDVCRRGKARIVLLDSHRGHSRTIPGVSRARYGSPEASYMQSTIDHNVSVASLSVAAYRALRVPQGGDEQHSCGKNVHVLLLPLSLSIAPWVFANTDVAENAVVARPVLREPTRVVSYCAALLSSSVLCALCSVPLP